MLVKVKPVVPIRGVTRNVILSEQTLDLNLFQIKKCMKFGSVYCDGTLLKPENVDGIFANNGITESETVVEKEVKPTIKEEAIKVPEEETKSEEKIVEDESAKVTEEEPSVTVEENESQQVQTTSKSKKNKNK